MGIGNAVAGRVIEGHQALITPHGDWKRAWRQPNSINQVNGSLPLMGIGNFDASPGVKPILPTHYPSWGLETHACVPAN